VDGKQPPQQLHGDVDARAAETCVPAGKTRAPHKGAMKPPRGLRFVTCYICGRDFGSASIAIHEPQCMKKWEAEMDALPPEQRRPRPVRPSVSEGASLEERNEAAQQSHEAVLSPCPHCGRTFNSDRLVVHLRSCGGKHGTSKPVHGKQPPQQLHGDVDARAAETCVPAGKTRAPHKGATKPPRGLRFVTCYICGRDFGSASIAIHEPQCMKKWEAEMDALPPEQRRPRPVRPSVSEGASLEERNEAAQQSHEAVLSPCPHCGRTFNSDRLVVHLRSCGGKHGTSKPMHGKHAAEAGAMFKAIDTAGSGWLSSLELHARLADHGLGDGEIQRVFLTLDSSKLYLLPSALSSKF
jgi:hypothetical protein